MVAHNRHCAKQRTHKKHSLFLSCKFCLRHISLFGEINKHFIVLKTLGAAINCAKHRNSVDVPVLPHISLPSYISSLASSLGVLSFVIRCVWHQIPPTARFEVLDHPLLMQSVRSGSGF